MGLIDQATQDWQRFSSDTEGWGVSINIETPSGSQNVDIAGLATKHHIGIDAEGNLINTKNAHISFAEKLLTDEGYPVRNTEGEVALFNHRVNYADSTGVIKKYVIREWFPDETVGVIVCILGDFDDGAT